MSDGSAVVSPLYASIELTLTDEPPLVEEGNTAEGSAQESSYSAAHEKAADRLSEALLHPETAGYSLFKPLLFWIAPLIKIAQQGSISEEDIWAAPVEVGVKINSDELEEAYNGVTCHDGYWFQTHSGPPARITSGCKPWLISNLVKSMPLFGWAIWFAFKRDILISGLYQAIFAILQLTLPFLIGELLEYISTGNGGLGYGFGIVIALGVVSCMSSYCIISTFYCMRRGSLKIKASTMMNVYRQSLHLTTASRQKCSVGQTTNLMSIDADKLGLALQFVHFLWHGPLAVIVIMVILSYEVGAVASVIGLSFLFFLMPVQHYIAKKIGRFRRLMVMKTDQRVKLTNEILQVIRAVKYYHWEASMYQRIQQVRQLEMDKLFTYLVVNGLLREMMFLSVPVAAFFIFVIYAFVEGREITVLKVFRVVAYLNTLRFPTHLFSQALKYISDASVSVHRLDDFMALSTLPSRPVENDSMSPDVCDYDNKGAMCSVSVTGYHRLRRHRSGDESGSIELRGAAFTWAEKDNDLSTVDVAGVSAPISGNGHTYNPLAIPSAEAVNSDGLDIQMTSTESEFELSGLNLSLKGSELVAVIGAVGAGKSSLVSAILGEMTCREGSCRLRGNVAYCAQTPWIQNLSLRENVLFGEVYVGSDLAVSGYNQRYYNALHGAALLPDLEILPLGDLTEIGERGINLSGGQKARVSLARALMAAHRSGIVLLDDPFSAVDGSTGESMFLNGVLDGLAGKLRLVVLNSHMHLLKHFDKVVMMDKGKIVAIDTPSALAATSSPHKELYHKMTGAVFDRQESEVDHADALRTDGSLDNGCSDAVTRKINREQALIAYISAQQVKPKPAPVPKGGGSNQLGVGQLTIREDRAVGNISFSVYINYFSACLWTISNKVGDAQLETKNMLSSNGFVVGVIMCTLLVILFAAAQAFRIAVDLLLVQWAQKKTQASFEVYVSILLSLTALILVRMVSLNSQAVRSSSNIHSYILQKVMNAPIPSFFDTHTVGEVLNRFAKDLEIVDTSIPEFFLQFLTNWFQIAAIFMLCVWSTPLFLVMMAPLAFAFYKVYVNFACVSRDLKRLESVCRTPVYSSFSETLNGLDTIRAYGDSERFIQNHFCRMDRLQKVAFHSQMVMSWVTARLELMVSFVMFSVAMLAVAVRSSVSEVGVGMALVYTLQLTAMFQRCVQLTIDLQAYFTSAERLLSYATIPQESPTRDGTIVTAGSSQFENWPEKGEIEFRGVNMRYRENDLVLKGLTFKVQGGSRVGVCGRTGAGKSSIMVALFRIVEVEAGNIFIDGRDTGKVPLGTLRSRLAIIPQDPVLFSGNIRFQLDPFSEYTDVEVWQALDNVHMADTVRSMPGALQADIAENGDNLSQGQRQLLCIARALLRRSKVLIMDEATSAVDPHTDACIQQLLRSSVVSSGCTVLTIAHRLQTIVDYDYILVMDRGKVAEYGAPSKLLGDSSSMFYSMYNTNGGNESMSNSTSAEVISGEGSIASLTN